MSLLSVKNISAGYGKHNIIENISFDTDAGMLMGIIGANGSGKTTLLKALCGILPHQGNCSLEDCVLEELSARQLAKLVSYIPQRSGISIDISALDVVLMGFNPCLGLLEHPTQTMVEAAQEALRQVGLGGNAQSNYLHLSEGQKQLCILARTLVSQSRLLLLDEPESALDFRFRYLMLDMLRQWTAQHQTGALITLHDPMLALNYCDRLLLLADGSLIGQLLPHAQPLKEMEAMLSQVYGPVSLQRCQNRSGKDIIVMLKEDAL